MFYVRTTKTASSATAVQVVKYKNRKTIIVRHIGSTHDAEELKQLKISARQWIKRLSGQQTLFPEEQAETSNLVSLQKCQYLGVNYFFIYEVLSNIFSKFGFSCLDSPMLLDLALMRIIEPASKLRSLELLKELFGIKYSRREFYRQLPNLNQWKEKTGSLILDFAKKEFNFNFSIVFYDVTTLYFETFRSDELRKTGFSKDSKPQQPQILIGLIVNTEGFPVAYEVFEGNKFEGHTLIPIILEFKRKYDIEKLTVVADAAMISWDNIQALEKKRLSYIVGARTGNLPLKQINEISQKLNRKDSESIRLKTDYGSLVCDFSQKRYCKDKCEMEKQLEKAKKILNENKAIKRSKFLKNKNKSICELNTKLIKKTEKLLGIKGYYTNLPEEVDNLTIINHYHNLWHVEQAFRVAKSDLEFRPIYHFKRHTIEAHILICFIALAVCKYIEIKTGASIALFVKRLMRITDARIFDTLAKKEIVMRSEITPEIKHMLGKLSLSY
ncbi:MAG: IS1634 family transposase [Elusimicrobiota bacterium]